MTRSTTCERSSRCARAANAAQASVQLSPCAYCITVSSGVARSASSATASLKGAFSTSSRGCAELLANELNWPSRSCSLLETVPAGGMISTGADGDAGVGDDVGDDDVGPGAGGAAGAAARCLCQR